MVSHRFVVMENLFPSDTPVHEAYDLKGSMAGRYASEQEVFMLSTDRCAS